MDNGEKLYRAIIIIGSTVTKMIMSGKNKKEVRQKLIDFYVRTREVEDYEDLEIFLIEVVYMNGDYYEVERHQ